MALELTVGGPRPNDLTLKVNAQSISGWTSVRVTRGLERIPNTFEISLTSREASGFEVIVNHGDPCTVSLGNDLVITGHIDSVTREISAKDQSIAIVGRSKSADLVDCSAELDSNFVKGVTLPKLARKIAEEVYGIEIKTDGADGPILPPIAFANGTTGFSLIERHARWVGKLLYDNADGSVQIGDLGTRKAASGFSEGVNIERAQAVASEAQRYSEVRAYLTPMNIIGNLKAQGDASKGDVDNVLASERDPNIRRRRTLLIVSEAGIGGVDVCKKRALWEIARRKGRGLAVRLTADNWRDSDGKLWAPNTLVPVDAPSLKLNGVEMCIGEVSYRRDELGTRADLILMPPDAFKPQPVLLQPSYELLKKSPGT